LLEVVVGQLVSKEVSLPAPLPAVAKARLDNLVGFAVNDAGLG
jgi:hypothetical protein